jgi:hypothetical protein
VWAERSRVAAAEPSSSFVVVLVLGKPFPPAIDEPPGIGFLADPKIVPCLLSLHVLGA